MNEILCRQLALDYCCNNADVLDEKNHFSEFVPMEGRRRYQSGDKCFLKLAVVNGKLLFTGQPEIINRCRKQYCSSCSEWFLEAESVRKLDDCLREFGWKVDTFHPYYIAETITEIQQIPYEIHWYDRESIKQFRGDNRFDEAFAFRDHAPDVIGVSAQQNGEILGMAGASADSPTMQQIGINVEKSERGKGIGTLLVSMLKNEILRQGYLPFYGTSISHLASQRLALSAGFLPAWIELFTVPLK